MLRRHLLYPLSYEGMAREQDQSTAPAVRPTSPHYLGEQSNPQVRAVLGDLEGHTRRVSCYSRQLILTDSPGRAFPSGY